MDCYIIPPLSNIELMSLGNRFFCLAQLYNKPENSAYREFFKRQVEKGEWVTLDNGAGDHDIISSETLFNIMIDLQPSEVIPPDILFNGIETIRNLETFINAMNDEGLIGKIEVLGCPQGKTQVEWLFVYEYMLRHPFVNTIGMSKIAVPAAFLQAHSDQFIKEGRRLAYDFLQAHKLIEKPLHFLGMGDPREFSYYKGNPFVRSTDSCNTIWSAMNGINFNRGDFKRIATPKDYFEKTMTDIDYNNALRNVQWFKNELLNI
jgi:hypothetical protein